MSRFYFAGHNNFGNRGCEALIRSTVSLLESSFNAFEALTPTADRNLDINQWPEAPQHGVRFVPAAEYPTSLRWWNRVASRIPWVKSVWKPKFSLSESSLADIKSCDAVLMTGGDVISLEYSLGSLFLWSTIADSAIKQGVPAVLWAASVGPFSGDRIVERYMVEHLRHYSAITVRETETLEYLKSLGIDNVTLVADPAFVLKPEPFDMRNIWPEERNSGVLGFNVSPLIAKFRKSPEDAERLEQEVVGFIQDVLNNTDLSVLLVPHVDPLDGSEKNSDSRYMARLSSRVEEHKGRLSMSPPTLNAPQIKYLLSQCRYFIGARTHATIGALSTEVPTISIAYSIKAKGLNKDLFTHTRYVLDTPKVSRETLWSSLETLQSEESAIKALLAERIPVWKARAKGSADVLQKVLASR